MKERPGVRQFALQPVGQQPEARADVADHLGLREKHLLDRGGKSANVQDRGAFRPHEERRLFDSVVTDRDDEVGAIDRPMDIILFREGRSAHVEAGPAGDGALAHLRVDERDLQAPHEV